MIPNLPRWMIMDTNGCSEIDWIVRSCDVAFESPVSRRVIYPELLAKIGIRGNFFFAVYHGEVIGYCAFYRNDLEQKTGYISLIGVVPKFQKMHVGTKLLNSVLDEMYSYGMRRCLLEVRKNNENAIQFYKSNHFIAMEDRVDKYLMKRDF